MNFINLCLTAHFYWNSIEPDGSICYQCGDRCFLEMFSLVAKISGTDTIIDTNVVVCGSCRKLGE